MAPIIPPTTATINVGDVATTLGNATKNMGGFRGFGGSVPASGALSMSQCQIIQKGVGYYNSWTLGSALTSWGSWLSTAITNNDLMTYAVWVSSTQTNATLRNIFNVNATTADGNRRPGLFLYQGDTGFYVRHDTNIAQNQGITQTTSRMTENSAAVQVVVTISGSTMKAYVNGTLSDTFTFPSSGVAASASTTDLVVSPGAGYVGQSDYAMNYLWFFPYPMTDTQVSTYYSSLSSTVVTPSFYQTLMSTAGYASRMGAFSLKALNGTSALVINVRNGSTSTTSDFYADISGNLTTGSSGTGTGIVAWLNGATGFVVKWYDQSGNGMHMSCSSTTIQPKIDTTNKWIDFKTSAYFDTSATLSSGPIPYSNAKNYTIVAHHNTIANTNGGICGCMYTNTINNTNNFRANLGSATGSQYSGYWFNNDFLAGTYVANRKLTWKWDGTNRTLYENGTSTKVTASTGWTQTVSTQQLIGKTTNDSTLNGELYSLFTFNSALSDSDRYLIEGLS